MTDTVRKVNRLLRPLFLVGGVVLTVVGVIGLVTPGWPGTIFLILAAGSMQLLSKSFVRKS